MNAQITCHNKACKLRVPITKAKNRNGQLYCGEKCASGENPPESDKSIGQRPQTLFFARPMLPAMSQGAWD